MPWWVSSTTFPVSYHQLTLLQYLAEAHFEPPIEFLDLFLPVNISSASRAQAFLWMVYRYLSPPDTENPFDDEYSRAHPGKAPRLLTISREEMLQENQDPEDEVDWGRRMSQMRSKFLKELVDEMEAEKRRKKNPPPPPPPQSSSFSTTMLSSSCAFPAIIVIAHRHFSRPGARTTEEVQHRHNVRRPLQPWIVALA